MVGEKKERLTTRLANHLRSTLVSGIFVLVPLAITLVILKMIFKALTAFVLPFLRPLLDGAPEYVLVAIASFATVLLIYAVGVVTTLFVGRRLLAMGEAFLLKVPVVKTVYSASKQVVETFSTSKANFSSVVMVEFPREGCLAVGFVTGTITDPDGRTMYRVFVPTTPNPTSGFLVIFPEEQLQFSDLSVEDGVKMIVSGGMLSPRSFKRVPKPAMAGAAAAPALNGAPADGETRGAALAPDGGGGATCR